MPTSFLVLDCNYNIGNHDSNLYRLFLNANVVIQPVDTGYLIIKNRYGNDGIVVDGNEILDLMNKNTEFRKRVKKVNNRKRDHGSLISSGTFRRLFNRVTKR